jgi:hypothetical protein
LFVCCCWIAKMVVDVLQILVDHMEEKKERNNYSLAFCSCLSLHILTMLKLEPA